MDLSINFDFLSDFLNSYPNPAMENTKPNTQQIENPNPNLMNDVK